MLTRRVVQRFFCALSLLSWGCGDVSSSPATSPAPSTPGRPAPGPESAKPVPTPPGPPAPPAPARPDEPIDVAITVDDLPRHGPDLPGVTRRSIHERMLAVFAAHETPPVYGFINAQKLEGHAEEEQALRAWVGAGHPLGNHTYSHVDGAQVAIPDYLADVDKNEPALARLL